ncbi:MAG: 3-oxoacyl-ACP synthase [Prevotella sp.]|nr:3-oxoacyl-ACP synthase [Prevotella sp.]
MIYILADNVTSPLGATTAQNYEAVAAGRSALRRCERWHGLEQPFSAALFTEEQTQGMAQKGLTRFESLAYCSALAAIRDSGISVSRPDTIFILSTTKANIELGDAMPSESAQHIAAKLGFKSQPIVVCNACISGVSAIMLAQRLLESGRYGYAVVCGADVQSLFTVAGFQSLGALSQEPCRPFDIDRTGLSLGEAAATIVFGREAPEGGAAWAVTDSAARNDACHVVTPSRQAEGASNALRAIDSSGAAFVNVHGTGTMFNDQMEAVALGRSGMDHLPVSALKGYFGHTLGAAGILETVMAMASADNKLLPPSLGFSEQGVSVNIGISSKSIPLEGQDFVKMISGFGGGNAAMMVRKVTPEPFRQKSLPAIRKLHSVHIESPVKLADMYRERAVAYPRFFKMDGLSRLGFMAAEMLPEVEDKEGCAVVLCCHSSSVATDRRFLHTLSTGEEGLPSPSLFIYTLPNIVAGEIAIRHRLKGETSLYIMPRRDDEMAWQLAEAAFMDPSVSTVIGGWLDYEDDEHFEAELFIAGLDLNDKNITTDFTDLANFR